MLTIRPERETDLEDIRKVAKAAFPTDLESRLVDLLRQNGKAVISLVAEQEDQVIGHVLFSPVLIVGQTSPLRGLGLAPVSVLPEFQRNGAGTGMIQLALKMAHLRGYDYVVVLGDPAYYQRFGFRPASQFNLTNEYGVDDEFMALEFRTGVLHHQSGQIQYAHEFSVLE